MGKILSLIERKCFRSANSFPLCLKVTERMCSVTGSGTDLGAGRLEVPRFVVERDDHELVSVRVVPVVSSRPRAATALVRPALRPPMALLHVGRVLGVGRPSYMGKGRIEAVEIHNWKKGTLRLIFGMIIGSLKRPIHIERNENFLWCLPFFLWSFSLLLGVNGQHQLKAHSYQAIAKAKLFFDVCHLFFDLFGLSFDLFRLCSHFRLLWIGP